MIVPQFQEVRIENTNACGYRCVMCPREKQTRKIGYMPLEDLALVAERLGAFQGNFCLHGFGEPLLDRSLVQKIQLIKKAFPQSMTAIFSTLGVKLSEEKLRDLATSGLDFMIISLYGFSAKTYQQVHGFAGWDLVRRNLEILQKHIRETNSSLHVNLKIPSVKASSALPMLELSEAAAFSQWAEELGCKITYWNGVHNYGDGRDYNVPDPDRRCPVVFGQRKKILHITWDLNVIPCCYDFNASIRFGNLRTQTLEEIFSSPAYFQFTLAQTNREWSAYSVCQTCEKDDY